MHELSVKNFLCIFSHHLNPARYLTPSSVLIVPPPLPPRPLDQVPNRSEDEVMRLAFSLWRNGFVVTLPGSSKSAEGGKKKAKVAGTSTDPKSAASTKGRSQDLVAEKKTKPAGATKTKAKEPLPLDNQQEAKKKAKR